MFGSGDFWDKSPSRTCDYYDKSPKTCCILDEMRKRFTGTNDHRLPYLKSLATMFKSRDNYYV